jgi:hypothetical protein
MPVVDLQVFFPDLLIKGLDVRHFLLAYANLLSQHRLLVHRRAHLTKRNSDFLLLNAAVTPSITRSPETGTSSRVSRLKKF